MRLCALALAMWPAVAGAQTITSAEFVEPTTRYDHGILGDAVEWGGLEITTNGGAADSGPILRGSRKTTWLIDLPDDQVFEDVEPRLWDVTGDGFPEVVVIHTHLEYGARLLVMGVGDRQAPVEIAQTPYIGRTHRWLAPIGAADLDGDGAVEIAYIDRPHLAKTLRIWRFVDGALTHVHDVPGLTNHRIGEDNIAGGIRDCGQGPEMITANANWTRIMATTFVDGRAQTRDIGVHESRASFDAAMACDAS
ncbi:FG-GAP repeat domain-containing protein [Yoonia maritima]|uniref:FG-GAP repeat domain-containing protein n=1 Tax=Yoonia maritima TaxID=1435347 RepID=UPI000D10440A|nr:VCBS repeat-containing protein [Yoonia maritima]